MTVLRTICSTFPGERAITDYLAPAILFGVSALLSAPVMILIYIGVAQAHFLLGYAYLLRSRRLNRVRLITVVVLISTAVTAYTFFIGDRVILFCIAGALFSLHFATDEYALRGERMLHWVSRAVASFFVFIFLVLMANSVGAITLLPPLVVVALACICLLCIGTLLFFYASQMQSTDHYLIYVGCLMFLLSMIGGPQHVLGMIILLHGYNWYVGYARRIAQTGAVRLKVYWAHVALSIFVTLCLYGVYVFAHSSALSSVLTFVFFSYYYNAWAIAHIVITARPLGIMRAHAS